MSKRIAIINGHPDPESFNTALASVYATGAKRAGASVQTLHIGELEFDPNLRYGYRKRMDLEPDLLAALDTIRWAEHLVWVHPVWWSGLPAQMKGFIDRLFLPGLTFQYRTNSVWWDKLLTGRSARIITTLDQPFWYYQLAFGNPSVKQLKRGVLQFCGVNPVRVSYFGPVRSATEHQRHRWLTQVEQLGHQLG
ncbi:flavodoxin family protein [Rudanella paleaurantiibacter]|uniref:Flavodoxin family protein n=1 Tax=Rudanella paleaurantiibacter TaxID=2614655 RepID=A0A7J5TUQ6_9BACT|nr:NAD(P)H-dependent oxidoreductase [Rudanella paleaurantiibacter]KAB7727379.1 flavodoxin family protein [Rudanella paleaurantiibacter]